MKNILLRSISGLVYVLILLGSLILGPAYFCALCMIFGVLAIIEFDRLMNKGVSPDYIGLSIDIFGILALTSIPVVGMIPGASSLMLLMVGALAIVFYSLLRFVVSLYNSTPSALHSVASSVFGVSYIGIGLISAQILATSTLSTALVILIFIFIWVNDTGAFLVGCTLGKHRLFERLSPKKSWEGFLGGLVLVMIVSLVLGYTGLTGKMLGPIAYFGVGPYTLVYLLPLVVVAFSTWGDLFESMIKRNVGVKDSGNLIPGHGGLLDRIDSMLFVMPACALLILCDLVLG